MSNQLSIKRSIIKIGIDKPIKFLHITDAHIDIIKACGKEENVSFYEEAMKYAQENGMFVVCTGDNFKGISEDNIAYALKNIYGENNIFLIGNHDFCACPDNLGLGDPAYQEEYAEKWAPCYVQNMYFDSIIIGGVNFVMLQNIYYSISYDQIQLLQAEVSKGYPIVLCMHIPLFSTKKADEILATWARCGYMIAPPEKYYVRYNERHQKEQIPSSETLESVGYISKQPAIKAIIAGHIHENFDGYADCGIRQITTAPLKDGVVRIIEII